MATLQEKLAAFRTLRQEALLLRRAAQNRMQAWMQAKAELEAKERELEAAQTDLET